MADQAAEPEAPKTTKKTVKDAATDDAPAAVSEAVPAAPEPVSDGSVRLRYTGPAPVIVMDLGGEVVPDQVVRVPTPALAASLTSRGDFEVDS